MKTKTTESRKLASRPETPPSRKRIAVDFFSGCGGLSTGLARAGFSVRLAVDNDPFAIHAYSLNHSDTKTWCRDLSDLSSTEVLASLQASCGEIDLVAGCPPCQGFSTLRTLNGRKRVDDSRNDLVLRFGQLVIGIKPKAILMENVPGLADDARFITLVRLLRRHGYKVRWRVLDASDYGVPQRRRRLILFGAHAGSIAPPNPSTTRASVRDTIEDLPPAGASSDAAHDHLEKRTARVQSLIRRIPKDGGSRTDLDSTEQLECHRRTAGFHDVYGRMAWDKVAPTITSGFVNPSKGRFLHPDQDRTITLREAALLQSFPPDYKFPMFRGKYAVARLIGNAVPPRFAEAQAATIVTFLDKTEVVNG